MENSKKKEDCSPQQFASAISLRNGKNRSIVLHSSKKTNFIYLYLINNPLITD